MRTLLVSTLMLTLGTTAQAQEFPKPGPEHKMLKALEGTWETTMKAGGMEHKGTMTYKMELGGMWLGGAMESDLGGEKFFGKSLDSYDAKKKKYIGVWCDSMSAMPMVLEGSYDSAKKTLTMLGEGPTLDGKMAKWRSVVEMKDDNNMHMSMYVGDGKEPMFTIGYKRKN